MFKLIMEWLLPEPPPVLQTMPKHVADMHLDMGLISLAMENARNENPAVDLGYKIPRV